MRIITEKLINNYKKNIFNIHPSLLRKIQRYDGFRHTSNGD